jgi:hypothetical protein
LRGSIGVNSDNHRLSGGQPAHHPGRVDLDLHRLTLRLVDARPDDVRLVRRQYPAPAVDGGASTADVVVRFVDALAMSGDIRRIGEDLVDDEGVVLVRAGHGSAARIRVQLGEGGSALVCERHVREVPLLATLLRLAAVRKGLLPLHAVAFRYQGVGVAATGWSGSGKTATLLAMLAVGAQPVSAEWVLVTEDGCELLGVPQTVRLKPSHVERWAALASLTGVAGGARRRLLSALRPVATRVAPSAARLFEQALHVDVPLHRLAHRAVGASGQGCALPTAPFDVLVLLEDAEVAAPTVEPVSAAFAVERILVGLEHDLTELEAARRALRYSWPGSGDDFVGAADAAHRQLLTRHLASRPIFLLRHRQPTPFDVLRAAVEQTIG